MERQHVDEREIPVKLLTFDREQWKGRDETAAFNRWRETRRKWADRHGWHTTEETRLLEEKHLAARVLERQLATCTDPDRRAEAFRAYEIQHVQGLRVYREAMWRTSP